MFYKEWPIFEYSVYSSVSQWTPLTTESWCTVQILTLLSSRSGVMFQSNTVFPCIEPDRHGSCRNAIIDTSLLALLGLCLFQSCVTSFVSSVSHLQNGVTPLLIASNNGHIEVAKILLNSGAKDIPDQVTLLLCEYISV